MPGKMLNVLKNPPSATDLELETALKHYKELRELVDFGEKPSEDFIRYKTEELKKKIKVLKDMDDNQLHGIRRNILAQCNLFCEKLEFELDCRARKEIKKLA